MPNHPQRHRLARWLALGLYASGALLLASGVGWLGLHHLVGAGAGELPHPLEAWALRLHGAAAYAGLFVLGAVAAAHLPPGWRLATRRRWAYQRRSGLLLCGLAAALAASGYGLYYFAPEWLRPALGWGHAAAGAAMALTLTHHRRGARRSALTPAAPDPI